MEDLKNLGVEVAEEYETSEDGGYYAIKGFLYQFDKTISKIFELPKENIYVEYIQDINTSDFVLQCKYKETQDYANSKIRDPIKKLIEIHKRNKKFKLCLYCYFKDKEEHKWILSIDELDSILGKDMSQYTKDEKESFIQKFHIEFSSEYELQFERVVDTLKEFFGCRTDQAIMYHALLRSELLRISINKNRNERKINSDYCKRLIGVSKNKIFQTSYTEYLGKEKYLRYIRGEYFSGSVNINKFERLFMLSLNTNNHISDILNLVIRLKDKFFKKYKTGIKSPPPYICIVGKEEVSRSVKQKLVDKDIIFTDGTTFNGDIFRMDKLILKSTLQNGIEIRFVSESNLETVMEAVSFDEVFVFAENGSDYFEVIRFMNEDTKYCFIELDSASDITKLLA